MSRKQKLTPEQEKIRLRGLRILARMIARAHLVSQGEGGVLAGDFDGDGPVALDGATPGRTVNMSGKPRKRRVLVISQAAWAHMDRLNISQNELAELLGRSSPFVSQILNGAKSPSPETRRRMQEVLGAGFDELFVVVEVDDE